MTIETDKQDDYLVELLTKETDRGAALVGGSIVDEALGDLLLACMNDTKLGESLVEGGAGAPLGTFSAKHKMARAIGLVTDAEHADVNLIRRIRNEAAHVLGTHERPMHSFFEVPDNKAMCMSIRNYDQDERETRTRWRYTMACAALGVRFQVAAKVARAAPVGERLVAAIRDAQDREHEDRERRI